MNALQETIGLLRKNKEEICEGFGVKKLAIFGSLARHEEASSSDIDIVIDFAPEKGLFVFIDLQHYLETLLRKKVDLVT